MAKGTVRKLSGADAPADTAQDMAPVDNTLFLYAEALGTAMGQMQNRVEDWKGQRAQLVKQLSTMVADAQAMLADLGHSAGDRLGRLRGRRRKAVAQPNPAGALKPEKRKERQSSVAKREATAKAKVAAAQKRPWAEQKAKRMAR